jgi:Flp pilus assembly protein TadG
MPPPNRRKRQAGTAVVETSLTLGLYLAIVFSLWDFGYMMFLHQTLAHRAEVAARYGALHPTDTTGMKNYVLHSKATGGGSSALFGLTAANVTATRSGAGTNEDRVTVTIANYRFPSISLAKKAIGKPITVTMPVEAN